MKIKRMLLFMLVIIFLSGIPVCARDPYNAQNVINIVKELSSEKYMGRLSGDKGAELASDYIADYFQSIGLKPGGDNGTYYQYFDVYFPAVNGQCSFKVFDKSGKLVKEYKYAVDFKEDTTGNSSPGTARGNITLQSISIDTPQPGAIILFNEPRRGETQEIYEGDARLKSMGVQAVISPPTQGFNFRKRTHAKFQGPTQAGPIKIVVSDKVYDELVDFSIKGYEFEIKSTLEMKKARAGNVIGIIKGRQSRTSPIILSAHYDAQGYDADGVFYPSALDNASGVAFMMECARLIKNSGTPDRTVIFVAFAGEEQGLIGSEYFASNPPVDIDDAYAFNFDMIGTKLKMHLQIDYSGSRNSFTEDIKDIADSQNIANILELSDGSDHASLSNHGANAITFFYNDRSNYHMSTDTADGLSPEGFKDVFTIMYMYLKHEGIVMESTYIAPKPSKGSFPYILPGIGVVAAVMIFIYFYHRRQSNTKAS